MTRLASSLAAGVFAFSLAGQGVAADLVLEVLDPPGAGFNDETPVAPVGGNPGTTLGEQRRLAFEQALGHWGAILDSSVAITVEATFAPLDCGVDFGVLGQAAPADVQYNLASLPNVVLPTALANAIMGTDLSPGVPDISAEFNGDLSCFNGLDWYYGFDGLAPDRTTDLISTVLHEVGHGLGFMTFVDNQTGLALVEGIDGPLFNTYTANLLDAELNQRWTEMTDTGRAASALNVAQLTWDGASLKTAASWLNDGHPVASLTPPLAGFSGVVADANFGALLVQGAVSGSVALSTPEDGCASVTGTTGQIALLLDGVCSPINKAYNAEQDGALAVVLISETFPPEPVDVHPEDVDVLAINIPIVSISAADALLLVDSPGAVLTLEGVSGRRVGTHANGNTLMFTVDPLQPASSVSHFDRSLRRDAIMEPVASQDIHYDLTLETAVLRDMGWPLVCGNGQLDGTEECDDGAGNSDSVADACRTTCKNPLCGDSVVDSAEECDPPGSQTPMGACLEGCRASFCGDGVVNPGEVCDNGVANSDAVADACRTTCQPAACGDGVVDSGEACDEISSTCVNCAISAGIGGAGGVGAGGVSGMPPVVARKDDGGCGCRAATSERSTRITWLGLLAVLAFSWRRRFTAARRPFGRTRRHP